jgi:hypothetical protein
VNYYSELTSADPSHGDVKVDETAEPIKATRAGREIRGRAEAVLATEGERKGRKIFGHCFPKIDALLPDVDNHLSAEMILFSSEHSDLHGHLHLR